MLTRWDVIKVSLAAIVTAPILYAVVVFATAFAGYR